jgi:hypothetical protein
VIGVFGIAFRLQRFWDGLMAGIRGGMITLGPAISAMIEAFRDLFDLFGFGAEKGKDMGDSLPSSAFVRFGQVLGRALVFVVRFVVVATTMFVTFARSVIETARSVGERLTAFFAPLRPIFQEVVSQFMRFFVALVAVRAQTDQSAASWSTLARIIQLLSVTVLPVLRITIGGILVGVVLLLQRLTALIGAFSRVIDLARSFAQVVPAPIRRGLAAAGGIGGGLIFGEGGGAGIAKEPIATGVARGGVGEELARPVRETAAARVAREESNVRVQQDIIDALRAQEGGVFRLDVNLDGRRIQEVQGRMERTEQAARGVPVEGDQ